LLTGVRGREDAATEVNIIVPKNAASMSPFVFFFTSEISGLPRYILFQLIVQTREYLLQ
jgi:hypothetical protein